MSRTPSDRTLARLAPWPLLAGAVLAFTFGVGLLDGQDARNGAGEALTVVGAVLVGAWIALLARTGHTGTDRHDTDRTGDD